MKILFYTALLFSIVSACSKPARSVAQNAETTTIAYKESIEDFPNPERGFYRYTETTAGNFTPLSLDELRSWRGLSQADNGNYKIYSTLVFRYYILDAFKNTALSAAFLNSVDADFNIARLAGVKIIPRFTYTNTVRSGNCPEGFICPPYGDAPKEMVLQHIKQLKEVFYKNADVTACVQMGFIGVWGEQYYTDHFGDASGNGTQKKLLDENWQDRIDVLKALLTAVPGDRMVQVRYPQMKQRAVYGIHALVNVAPVSENEAFSGTDKARIGFHNDCFLSSPDDYGTYEDYGNSVSDRKNAAEELKKYAQADGRFVAVGGETCDDAYSPENDCSPAGIAQTTMAALHYSFLNCAYNNAVNNDWQTGGCMNEIKRNLGYRFVLKTAAFPKTVSKDQFLSFKIALKNKGYASCFNPRPVKIVLRNKATGQQYFINTDANPVKWFSGEIKWESAVALPVDITPGMYETFLFLPDMRDTISLRPEYAIRFANEDIWENATGFNRLGIDVEIK